MVSLITPAFNSEKYINETYQSILRQTDSDWEWVIVDDGSTDSTLKILREYAAADSRIHYYQRDRLPKGAATCRNIGVEKCSGEYLIFIDTDDILASFCIEQRTTEMKRDSPYDFIVFQMMLFNQKADDIKILWNVEDSRDDLERAIRLNPVMAGSSTIWKKESFTKIGLWDDKILINQDIELHIRAISNGLRYLLRLDLQPDLFVRNNQQSISRAKKKSLEKQLSRVYYYQKILEQLEQSQLLQNYQPALRWLFLKLFFDLLFDKETAVATKLYTVAIKKVNLYKKHKIICGSLLAMGKTSKPIIALIRFVNRRLLSKTSNNNKTHGKLFYDKTIKF